jgi:glycosyltransferase involved in cell wall biosynthesis
MSAGLPVVATRSGGTADHLREGVNALFVPPRNVHELSRAIERLLEDPAMRERMSNANRRKVKDFAPDIVAKDYVRALEDLSLADGLSPN